MRIRTERRQVKFKQCQAMKRGGETSMSKKILSLLLILCLTSGLLFSTSESMYAESTHEALHFSYGVNIPPLHDAVVYNPDTNSSRDPDTNYHNPGDTLPIADGMTVEFNKSYTYFKFDISHLPKADQLGTTLFSVWGRDTSRQTSEAAASYIQIFGADDARDWTETDLTWNNKPVMGSEPIAEVLYSTSNAFQDADITNYIKQQKQSGAETITLIIAAKALDGIFYHRGKDTTVSGQHPPRLIVTDPADVPEDMRLGQDGRSRLYPADWYPGFKDDKGRFLHDFSYAGYRRSEQELPEVQVSAGIDVTEAPYYADNTGELDATDAIQRAIQDAAGQGGGVVYLPPGTYQVNPPATKDYALILPASDIVLKGAGIDHTFIYNATENMRFKDIIRVGDGDWKKTEISTKLNKTVTEPTVLLAVEDTRGFEKDDFIMITFDTTQEFLNELGMHNRWASRLGRVEPIFYRQVVGVDHANRTITLDIPTRYPLKQRDNITITKTEAPLKEIGLEDFSIANMQNSNSGLDENDYREPGTAGYESDNAKAINMIAVADSWIRNVSTYKPPGNAAYHLLSNGIILDRTKNVTIDHVTMQYPQYRGANGNGYLYQFKGNDSLVTESTAVAARHNFTFANFAANGNVMHNVRGENSTLLTDFHMYLSMANLIDNMTLDRDGISAISRDYGSSATNRHGVVTTESVFWNTTGIAAHRSKNGIIIESEQFGHGYIIGTKGAVTGVNVDIIGSISDTDTSPFDMAEGIAEGERLTPQSLYEDQAQRRLNAFELALQSLLVNGEAVSGMQFLRTGYTYTLPYGTEQIPTIQATPRSSAAEVTITQPAATNGTGVIHVEKDGISQSYTIDFRVAQSPLLPKSIALVPDKSVQGWRAAGNTISAGNSGKLNVFLTLENGEIVNANNENIQITFTVDNEDIGVIAGDRFQAVKPGAVRITVEGVYNGHTVSAVDTFTVLEAMQQPEGTFAAVARVTASADDGNLPGNAIDRDPDSRWSAEGKGQYLLLELDKEQWVDKVSILFYNGNLRANYFDLEVSADGVHYQKVIAHAASRKQEPNHYETFGFTPVKAKYIKFTGQGNEINLWNSIIELWVHQHASPPDEPVPSSPFNPGWPAATEKPVEQPESHHPDQPVLVRLDLREPDLATNFSGQTVARLQLDITTLREALNALKPEQLAGEVQLYVDARGSGSMGTVLLPVDVIALALAKAPLAVLVIEHDSARYELKLKELYTDQSAAGAAYSTLAIHMERIAGEESARLKSRAASAEIALLHDGIKTRVAAEPAGGENVIGNYGKVYAPVTLHLTGEIDLQHAAAVLYDPVTGEMRFVPAIFRHVDGNTEVEIYRTGDGIYTVVQSERTFADVSGHWAQAQIESLASKLLVKGRTNDRFAPNDDITRAEFAALVSRAAGLTPAATDIYTDVLPGDWYAGAVGAATAAGIVNGAGQSQFRPDDPITREQMAVMVMRMMAFAGYSADADMVLLNGFSDSDSVNSYARQALAQAVALKIVNGVSEQQLAPQKQASRAEAVMMIERMLKQMHFLGPV
ncbi:DNRLRE domain-containing protein [Paenibacillaceae bacterium]|nr:DNRLRE domain-containing protein [Paenibacillaceae bacterium]